jgi:hypothetical protein
MVRSIPFKHALRCLLLAISPIVVAERVTMEVSVGRISNDYEWSAYDTAYSSLLGLVRSALQSECERASGSILSYVDRRSVKMTIFERGHTGGERGVYEDGKYFLTAERSTGVCTYSEQSASTSSGKDAEVILADLKRSFGTYAGGWDRSKHDSVPISASGFEVSDAVITRHDTRSHLTGKIEWVIADKLRSLCKQKSAGEGRTELRKVELSGISYQTPPKNTAGNTVNLMKPYKLSVKTARTECLIPKKPEKEVAKTEATQERADFWSGKARAEQAKSANSGFWSGENEKDESDKGTSNADFWSGKKAAASASASNDFWAGDTSSEKANVDYEIVSDAKSRQGVKKADGRMLIPFGDWEILSYKNGLAKVRKIISFTTLRKSDCFKSGLYERVVEDGYIGEEGSWLIPPTRNKERGNTDADICLIGTINPK